MKGKYRAVYPRVFVKDRETGEPVLVACPVIRITSKMDGYYSLFFDAAFDERTLPPEFDTVFPQDVYLVYQMTEADLSEFFKPNKLGKMLTLEGFQTIFKGQTLMLIKQGGDVSIAPPDLEFVCRNIKREVGGV